MTFISTIETVYQFRQKYHDTFLQFLSISSLMMTKKKKDSQEQNSGKQTDQAPKSSKELKINACDASYCLYFS